MQLRRLAQVRLADHVSRSIVAHRDSDYLSCNKDKFSTTQLVGAGIGVTILIFALSFGILWLVRRRKGKSGDKNAKHDDEERVRAARADSDDSDSGTDSDDSSDDEDLKKKEKPHKRDHHSNRASSALERDRTRGRARDEDKPRRGERTDRTRSPGGKSLPPRPTVEDAFSDDDDPDSGHLRPPTASARSSRLGSPTESRSVRQLYPTNPSPRDTLRPPSREPPPYTDKRPHSSVSTRRPSERPQAKRPVTTHTTSRSLPTEASRPLPPRTSSNQQGARPRPATRSDSVYSTDTDSRRMSYHDMPLPQPPTASTPVRTSSRRSVSGGKAIREPESPLEPVPAIPASRARGPSPMPVRQDSAATTVSESSRPGVSRQSTAVSIYDSPVSATPPHPPRPSRG